ncbi:MAG: AAA family ATPase [Nitrospiraceae bacterium]
MYKAFYNLKDKPFSLLPNSDFLYLGATHRTAYSLMEYGLLNEAPFMVLTGDPGMGKTSLLQKLIEERRRSYSIGFVTNARYDAEHLLPWILLALGLSQKQMDPVEAYHVFSEFLASEAKQNRRVLLIVDEAQSLGVDLLEELRLMSNMNQHKALQLQIILSGQPDLHQLLQRPDMTQFAQRIVVDYHLRPFTEEETIEYIEHRVRVAGAPRSLFSRSASRLAHRLSKGNPRLINQVCEIALTYGFAQQVHSISAKLLAQAALDRRKNKILPLAEEEDCFVVLQAPEEGEEPEGTDKRGDILAEEPTPVMSAIPTGVNGSAGPSRNLYQSGLALRKSRDFKAAIELFERAAAEDPSYHLKAFGQIGLCYRALGQPDQAVLAFRKAFADQGASHEQRLSVRYMLARTLEQMGEMPDALEQYRRISRTDRAFKDATVRIARLKAYSPAEDLMERFFAPTLFERAWKQVRQLLKGNA